MYLPVAHYLLAAVSCSVTSATDSVQMNASHSAVCFSKPAAVTECANSAMLQQ